MDDHKQLPRVLIVGESFDTYTGGGITLSNLFKGWPKERLAVVSELRNYPNSDVCNEFYRLGSTEWHYAWPFSHFIKNNRVSGKVDLDMEVDGRDQSHRLSNETWRNNTGYSKKNGFLWRSIHAFDELVGIEAVTRKLRLSPELTSWIRQFRPDLIYTQLGSLMLISLTKELADTFKIPYVIHIMDDWPTTLYADKLLAPYLRRLLEKEFSELVKGSSNFLGISQKMCDCYQERYMRPCSPFHNPLELERWLATSKKSWTAHNPFRMMYRGHLGFGIDKSLVDLCDAVYEIYKSGRNIQFEITLTPTCDEQTKQKFERPGCVRIMEMIPYAEIPSSLANADLLALAYDFDPNSLLLNRYSMPTRATEFMMSGTPVLIYGPGELAVVEYAQKEKWGKVVSSSNIEQLIQAIFLLMDDQTLREKLGHQAREVAVRNHNAVHIREGFRKALVDAADSPLKNNLL